MSKAIPGKNIRLLRRQLGFSLEALADAANVDSANLSRLENGKAGYSADSIQRIARALSVTVDVLFAEPEKVENATMRQREAPILTESQLAQWQGIDSIDYPQGQEYLWGDPRYLSRHVFGWRVSDSANVPLLNPGEELIFDANKPPQMGSLVIAQDASGAVFLGRYRQIGDTDGKSTFQVIPYDPLYASASSTTTAGLQLRGTLVEIRRRV